MEKSVIKIINWVGSTKSLIIHTILFIVFFSLYFFGVNFDRILLILTTILSLEAIYLSLLIQLSVNLQSKKIEDIQEDIVDIQDDIEDIQEDIQEE